MKLNLNPIAVSGVGNSVPIPVDTQRTATFAFNITYSTGNTTAAGTLQYTLDDVYAPGYNPSTGNWINVPSVTLTYAAPPLAQIVQLTGSAAILATAFRLAVTTSTGTVSIQGWQNVTSIT